MLTDAQFFKSFHYHLYSSKRNYSTSVDSCFAHYFARVLSGRARILSEGQDISVETGDIFFIPKGLKYRSYWTCTEGSTSFYSFGFAAFPVEAPVALQLQKLNCTDEQKALFTQLERTGQVGPAFVGCLYSFLASVMPEMTVYHKTRSHRIVDKAIDLMRSTPNASVAEIAHHCGVSECTLFLKFRKHFGKTPVELRHQILTEKANQLLTATDLSVEEISNRLGFSSSSYFRKVLKAETGKSPSEIRRNQRQLL